MIRVTKTVVYGDGCCCCFLTARVFCAQSFDFENGVGGDYRR
jgi:hypothetical protein